MRLVLPLCAAIALSLFAARLEAAEDDKADEEEADAVRLAENAFEYRDFKKVVEVLTTWQPTRIVNRLRRITAHRIKGISLHLLKDVTGAREELGQLLLEDPKHKLDPFAVPPAVIETFEAVRQEMKPRLDRILADRGLRPIDPEPTTGPPKLVLVETLHPAVALLPFGLPQFLSDDPALGAVFLAAQAITLTVNIVGFARADALDPVLPDSGMMEVPNPEFKNWRLAFYVGLIGAVASYGASVILAYWSGLPAYNARQVTPPQSGAEKPPGAPRVFVFEF